MGCDFIKLAVPGVRTLNPYLPGKPVEELAREQGLDASSIVKLASNENPLGAAQSSRKAIAAMMDELARYPDSSLYNLRDALSEKLAVEPDQITFGNGSNDILVLLAQCYLKEGCSAVFSEYAFAVYPIAVQAVGADSIVVPAKNWGHDLVAMAEAIRADTRMVFLANPNNPTGTCFSETELLSFLDQVPEEVIVVLDEAYFEYAVANEHPDGIALLKQYPNLVVVRTFSKAYGLAAGRLGYSVSSPEIASIINRLRQPFNVNSLVEAAAVAVLNDEEYLNLSRQVNQNGMAQIEAGFRSMNVDYIPSAGNFITFDVGAKGMEGVECYQQLLRQGVIVRPLANYGMPGHLRVSIGLEEENRCFLEALAAIEQP